MNLQDPEEAREPFHDASPVSGAEKSAAPTPMAPSPAWRDVRAWFRDILFAVGGAVIIVVFFYQPVKVEGVSMSPELTDQERIFVNKFRYRVDDIERGDIVVFWYPLDRSTSYIKRVVGVPGDVVEVRDGRVLVNGRVVDEEYVPPEYMDHRSFRPVVVDPGHYYVLGDHRSQSSDSRAWGLVPRENIYGKAVFRYWPVAKMGAID
jgi:signal peptidase I